MDTVMAIKRGEPGAALPERKKRRVKKTAEPTTAKPAVVVPQRSDVATDNQVPTPPFWGSRVVRGVAMADIVAYLDERATFVGQWGLKPTRGSDQTFADMVEEEGRPRLRMWMDRIKTEGLLEPAVVYGYFPAQSQGDDLLIYDPEDHSKVLSRLKFPRQHRGRFLCLSDFYRSVDSGEMDVAAFQIVTMGAVASESTGKLCESDAYREYLELHGLSVQLTEAMAELWHARVRSEWGFHGEDSESMEHLIAKQGYRGSRYSFGYPACPDVEQQTEFIKLLEPERIGVILSEGFQLHPEQSTSALVVHHPEAKYFNAT